MFHQGKHTNGHQAHEKCSTYLIIRKRQVKTQWGITACLLEWLLQKKRKNHCWWGYGGTGALLQYWQECKMVQPLWKTVWLSLRKWRIEPPYDPAFLLMKIYPKELKSGSWLISHIYCSITTTKGWKQPKYSTTDEGRKWGTCYSGIPFSHKKGGDPATTATCTDLENIMLRDIIQS